MDQAQAAALEALEATIDACTSNGFIEAWRRLVQDVYAGSLDRYEPDVLGDTPLSLGLQCSENLKTRAIRRFEHDDREPVNVHWKVDGLRVGNPQNVLTFNLGDARIVTMKVPFGERRSPSWNHSAGWEQDSQIRLAVATENSHVLQYRTHAEDAPPILPDPGFPGSVRNYMMLWAGEADVALTAGWLAVPILGETPFIAQKMLWWDHEPHLQVTTKAAPDRGPSFDERPTITPEVTLKKRSQESRA